MSIEARILGKLDATNVQIEINSSKGSSKPNYYNVPENKAEAFIADYEKAVKRNTVISNVGFVSSVLGGVILASVATRNLKNTALKWIINSAAGIAGAAASIVGCSSYLTKSHEACLKKHNAEQIFYDA